jgi:cell division protein FtsB
MPSFAVALPTPPGRRLRRPTRLQIGVVFGILVALWFVFAFARTMTSLNEATTRTDAVRAENAALTQRLAAAQQEADLLQSDAYLRFAARSFGMGGAGERAFGLAPGAPSPAPMVALGKSAADSEESSPLESWLNLLFGE